MIRSVEFDLETRSEANMRFASRAGMMAKSDRVKRQRAAVRDVLRSRQASPPMLQLVHTGMATPNRIRVTLTRIAPAELDDDNLRPALKAVRDEVATWIGVDDRHGAVAWSYEQERGAAHVYRVRIRVEDDGPGDPRVVVLPETASAGRAAAATVNRKVAAAVKRAHDPEASSRASSSSARGKAEAAFARMTGKPPTLETLTEGQKDAAAAIIRHHYGPAPLDPGEERPARDLAPCTSCGVAIGLPCIDVPGAPGLRRVHGVHVARARAAGLHVPDDDRRHVRPTRGPRKVVLAPHQRPLPLLQAWARLPWSERGKLTRWMLLDGVDPDGTVRMRVPEQHRAAHGMTLTLTRTRGTVPGVGEAWIYETMKAG